MTVRIYELSKKYNLSNKEILKLLQDNGFEISTHMSVAPQEVIDFLEKKLSKAQKPKEVEKPKEEMVKKLESTEKVDKIEKIKIVKEEAKEEKKIEPLKEIKSKEITLKPMTIGEFSAETQIPASDLILTLLRNKIVSTKNQILSEKSFNLLAQTYGIEIIKKADSLTGVKEESVDKNEKKQEGVFVSRLPIVVVIGHVDHGKTTLLDFIRKTRVAAKEKGGITQHLGAYEVKTSHGNIVFLDTPGHEAFSMMRIRGLKIADIAILIVAADDGVMPQTIEAIKHAQSVGLPIIVAINKIDKATPSQVESVKKQLTQYGLVAEDWGGQVVCIGISAKLGTGIDALLDVIALQSELMELQTNSSIPAQGYILESKMEKGRGFVATVLCLHGTLSVGDYFKAGSVFGRVSSMVDSYGKRVSNIGPSHPVQVAGFSELPQSGDLFQVITSQEAKKGISKEEDSKSILSQNVNLGNAINIILKTDNTSSKEALLSSINKISSKFEKKINVVHVAIGNINESDIVLASDTGSIIYGLHSKSESNAVSLAQKNKIKIKHFDIIYKLLEDLELELESNKPIKLISKKIGEAIVLKVFDIKNLGIIAGAQVKSGRFTRDCKLVIYRNKQKIGEGPIKSLQRERKAVKEVHSGFECGFIVDKFTDWAVDDRVECFIDIPEE